MDKEVEMTDFSELQRKALAAPVFDPQNLPGAHLPAEFMRNVGNGWKVGLSVNK